MTAEPLKRCSKCRVEKPLGEFHRDASKRDGREYACKVCRHEKARRRTASGRKAEEERRRATRLSARTPEQIEADRARLRPDGLKKCRSGHWLPFEEFCVDVAAPDGLRSKCRPCAGEVLAAWKYGAYAPSWEERGLYGCYLCGAPYEHADHKHPKALGGVDDPENLAPACAACNLSKSDTPLEDWRPDLAALVASWPVEVRLVPVA